MNDFAAPISEEIWDMKYRFKDAQGNPIDETVESTWSRISTALASVEKDPLKWSDEFNYALEDFKFLPAGRITAGAGTERNVTLFNCYVMGTIPDSMDGIFDMLKEAALTMQQGGGIGYDFTPLRPKGSPVKGVAADASGPLTFMDVWDAMCRTVMSAGSRRGAMMATMRCDHPDIMDFVAAKSDPARLRMFNLSVLVTDEFMEAVKDDQDWPLIHKKQPVDTSLGQMEPDGNVVFGTEDPYIYRFVKARDLWEAIMKSTYDFAEPGVIFIDRINKDNNLNYCEHIAATNPCGEQPLPPYGACLLGSLNLTRFVDKPFTAHAKLNYDKMRRVIKAAVRMMDNVNDVSKFPLPQQLDEAQSKRRIGLGITGLADMLAMLHYVYGSKDAADFTKKLMQRITITSYSCSVMNAKEKGSFPAFDADKFLAEGTFASRLPEGLKKDIRKHGIRNSHLMSIAPTGTISLYAGNVSSGIEPIFALSYNRKVLQPDGSKTEQLVEDYAVKVWNDLHEKGDMLPKTGAVVPKSFVTAQDLSPMGHLRMQAAVQPWVDSSISKTINLPEDISFNDFKQVYIDAYDMGCKGCTTYRPNEVTGSVISVAEDDSKAAEDDSGVIFDDDGTAVRPEKLIGSTYKKKYGGHAFYITINDALIGGKQRPFEIFINSKNMEHFAWTVGLTRMISAVFRRGGRVEFVAEELKNVFDPRGGEWAKGKYVPSVLAAIGVVVEEHMISIGYMKDKNAEAEGIGYLDPEEAEAAISSIPEKHKLPVAAMCPACGSFNTKNEAGCITCIECGHSKCG